MNRFPGLATWSGQQDLNLPQPIADHHRAPPDIPPHRWRQFLGDCSSFFDNAVLSASDAMSGWGSKPERIFDARISASAGCRHEGPQLRASSLKRAPVGFGNTAGALDHPA
jgi:hypothetical protein